MDNLCVDCTCELKDIRSPRFSEGRCFCDEQTRFIKLEEKK